MHIPRTGVYGFNSCLAGQQYNSPSNSKIVALYGLIPTFSLLTHGEPVNETKSTGMRPRTWESDQEHGNQTKSLGMKPAITMCNSLVTKPSCIVYHREHTHTNTY